MDIGPIIGGVVALLGTLIAILAGVVGWQVKKIWEIQNEDLATNTRRIASIEEQLRGVRGDDNDSGFTGMTQQHFEELYGQMEEMQDLIQDAERRREQEHMEVRKALQAVIAVLEEEGFNGKLPDKEDLEPDD